jgi:hypothetical protein
MHRNLRWIPLLAVVAACGGPAYFEGNPEAPPIEDLGFPAPDNPLIRTGCLLGSGGERTTGGAVYRSREADPDDLAGFYEEHGDGLVQRDLERGDQPPQVGQATVVRIDAYRDVAVVPIEGGVEVIAYIDDAPGELRCR